MNKDKGFTLIELLGVIILLGIIGVIAVPSITNLIKDSIDKAYQAQVNMVQESAKKWAIENIEQISEEHKTYLTVDMLIKNGYINKNEIADPRDSSKNLNGCVIIEYNPSYSKYEYNYHEDSCDEFTYRDSILNGADPKLSDGMIPVVWDGTNLVKAGLYDEWYNYSNLEWANAVMVTSDSRDVYNDAPVGTRIKEHHILTYFVWIPRYKYKLWNASDNIITTGVNSSVVKTIDIVFEGNTTTKSNGTINGEYLTHPAFTFGGTELNGFWMAKYETSSDESSACYMTSLADDCNNDSITPRIKPNKTAWRSIQIANAFQVARKMETNDNIYGLNSALVDTHIIKNMEWGAVAYLSYSNYGINSEVRINNSKTSTTGCAATNPPVDTFTNYKDYFEGCQNTYNTPIGNLASTTGNITGVYDMSGSAVEFVMGIMESSLNSGVPMVGVDLTTNSGFNGRLSSGETYTTGIDLPENKYYDLYSYGTTSGDQAAYVRGKLGDATREMGPFGVHPDFVTPALNISSWHGDLANFMTNQRPWIIRGSSWADGTLDGAFAFSNFMGIADARRGFRIVITNE
ncbi:MAG: prepilin-type N-terminal cleavage/methylation domain-containing protein [Bacilli bacterium]|nr:prepilin-type N-terminal cleavage/methylation domain-containing protein [Bacilli bacterium]